MLFLFIILGFLPSFAWLIFFLKEDIHPEPKKMIAKVFAWGALITSVAILIQYFFRYLLGAIGIDQHQLVSFLLFGTIEEALKFLVAYWVIRKSPFFDEPMDAMIYMLTAALGFALIENVAVVSGIKIVSEAIGILIFRFVGATLLHALSSAVVGYYWALSIIKNKMKGFSLILLWGIIFASILHGIFNYLIMYFREAMIYPIIFLIIVAFFVFWDFERIKHTNSHE